MESFSFIRRLLFPAPHPPHYEYQSHPDDMIWIPQLPPLHPIPCLLLQTRDADALILFAHGNGCDIGTMYDSFHYYKSHWRVSILIMEYPGYGECIGTPSEESINSNMSRCYEFCTKILHYPPDRIILFGQSIGTGPVCELAATLGQNQVKLGGVILQSPYTCLPDVVRFLARKVMPAASRVAPHLIRTGWNNLDCMRQITCPLFILHGKIDEIIPIDHSDLLYKASISQYKHLLCINQASHNVFDHHADIIQPILQFIQLYIRTTPKGNNTQQSSVNVKRAEAAVNEELNQQENTGEAQAAAALSSSSSTSSSSPSSSSSSSSSSSASPTPSSSTSLPYPTSPLPPSLLKVDKRYYIVPEIVKQHNEERQEEMRQEDMRRIKNMERKQAVRGFFSNLSTKFSNLATRVLGDPQSPDSASAARERNNNQGGTPPNGSSRTAPRGSASSSSTGAVAAPSSSPPSLSSPPPRAYSPAASRGRVSTSSTSSPYQNESEDEQEEAEEEEEDVQVQGEKKKQETNQRGSNTSSASPPPSSTAPSSFSSSSSSSAPPSSSPPRRRPLAPMSPEDTFTVESHQREASDSVDM